MGATSRPDSAAGGGQSAGGGGLSDDNPYGAHFFGGHDGDGSGNDHAEAQCPRGRTRCECIPQQFVLDDPDVVTVPEGADFAVPIGTIRAAADVPGFLTGVSLGSAPVGAPPPAICRTAVKLGLWVGRCKARHRAGAGVYYYYAAIIGPVATTSRIVLGDGSEPCESMACYLQPVEQGGSSEFVASGPAHETEAELRQPFCVMHIALQRVNPSVDIAPPQRGNSSPLRCVIPNDHTLPSPSPVILFLPDEIMFRCRCCLLHADLPEPPAVDDAAGEEGASGAGSGGAGAGAGGGADASPVGVWDGTRGGRGGARRGANRSAGPPAKRQRR